MLVAVLSLSRRACSYGVVQIVLDLVGLLRGLHAVLRTGRPSRYRPLLVHPALRAQQPRPPAHRQTGACQLIHI